MQHSQDQLSKPKQPFGKPLLGANKNVFCNTTNLKSASDFGKQPSPVFRGIKIDNSQPTLVLKANQITPRGLNMSS